MFVIIIIISHTLGQKSDAKDFLSTDFTRNDIQNADKTQYS